MIADDSLRIERTIVRDHERARRSDLDHHWDDHGPAAVVLVDPPAHHAPYQLPKLVRVVDAVGRGLHERIVDARRHVTERGGVLSHAAIVSREYGLPGVVGCVGAVKAATTGRRVRVDGGTGEVWILES